MYTYVVYTNITVIDNTEDFSQVVIAVKVEVQPAMIHTLCMYMYLVRWLIYIDHLHRCNFDNSLSSL